MSVLIKGMEMPKSCWACPMVSGYEIFKDEWKPVHSVVRCRILNKKVITENGIPSACPLVPVPHHGRLIDAEALINALQELFDKRKEDAEYMGFRGPFVSWNDAVYHIKDAPTIIPAEEG